MRYAAIRDFYSHSLCHLRPWGRDGALYSGRIDNGYVALTSEPDLMTQILQNSAAEMKDNDCFMVTSTEPGLQVSDFLMSYFSLFSQRDHDHFSGVTECDLIAPNVCALYFGVRNVEGEKGVTNSLRFEINPDTKSIKPDTFECFGVS